MDRRSFILGAAALAAAKPWRLFAQRCESQPIALDLQKDAPLLRFGVVSDIHVRESAGQYGTEVLVKALSYFRDRGVDAVAIAGDMADHGLVSQLMCVARAWRSVFPGDKAPDGRRVEKLFIYGNHDIEGFKYSKLSPSPEETIAADRAAAWLQAFGEPYEPIWMKTVKGCTFIGAHWDGWKGVPAIEPFLKKHAPSLRGDKPFFYIQHPHPKGTCHGSWAWGCDDGFATRALSQFPNAIAFSGHSHHPLVDERAIWQGSFTSIGAASLRYIDPVYGRENSGPSALDDLRQMPIVDKFGGKEGLVVSVYRELIAVERREFVFNGCLGPDWIVRPGAAKAPRPEPPPPAFPEGARITVASVPSGADRKGRTVKQLEAAFPAALHGPGHTRAYDYEVAAEVEACGAKWIACAKRVYSPTFFLPPEREANMVKCVFSLDELGVRKAPYFTPSVRFRVRAADSFGKSSRPLESGPVSIV